MILSRSSPVAPIPCRSRLSVHSCPLLLLAHLEDIKLQIIRIPGAPQYRMIRRLCPELHLPQPLMHILRSLPDRLCKKLLVHEMRAGAGRQIAAVFHQLHPPQVDLTVSFYRFLDGASGHHHIELLPLLLQSREQVEHILADKFHPVGKAV